MATASIEVLGQDAERLAGELQVALRVDLSGVDQRQLELEFERRAKPGK